MSGVPRRALHHTAASEVSSDTAQSSGMVRYAAISGRLAGSDALFMGETHMAGGACSANHHHGHSETAIYVLSGHPEFVYLDDGEEVRICSSPGDYIYVPPYAPHREENPARDEAVVVIARTTTEPIVVNLTDLAEGPVVPPGQDKDSGDTANDRDLDRQFGSTTD